MQKRIILRKLAPLSELHFGKHHGRTVIQVIALGEISYLLWMYYNKKNVSFNKETFREYVPIPPEYRIEKPGNNPELFNNKGKEIISLVLSEKDRDRGAVYAQRTNRKNQSIARKRTIDKNTTRYHDARRNHGHS